MDDIRKNVIASLIAAIIVVLASATLSLLLTVLVAAAAVIALLFSGPAVRWVGGLLRLIWDTILGVINKPATERQDGLEDRIATLETLLRSMQVRLAPPENDDTESGRGNGNEPS